MAAAPGDRKRGPPRAAEHQPALDAQVSAQALDVLDQLARGVGVTVAARRAASAAALVEQYDVEAGRVEELALARAAATARSAMQEEDRQAVGSAAALEVQTVGVADLEQAMREGRRGREEQGVGRHGVGEMLGMDGIRAGARVARVMASELAAQFRTGGTRA